MTTILLIASLLCIYFCAFSFVFGVFPTEWERRPTLKVLGLGRGGGTKSRQTPFSIIRKLAMINRPLCQRAMRQQLARNLSIARVNLSPEEFLLVKEVGVGLCLFLFSFMLSNKDFIFAWLAIGFVGGYMLPEFIVQGKIRKVKNTIIKELPDSIDLLGLCVNAGLDFMLALKWVVEKSPPSVMIDELNNVLQEISVGKTRRDAIKDLAHRYQLPDLSTFARTLVQADKMGTSVTEALNIISEDMRLARYRRGEQVALKAPMKMLVPLLFFIFPVVAILVAGPILLDFLENNPLASLTGG